MYIFSLLQSMNQILNTVQTSLIPSSQLLVQKSTTASDGMREQPVIGSHLFIAITSSWSQLSL